MIEVLIPVRDGERFLAETLASVRGATTWFATSDFAAVRESLKRKGACG